MSSRQRLYLWLNRPVTILWVVIAGFHFSLLNTSTKRIILLALTCFELAAGFLCVILQVFELRPTGERMYISYNRVNGLRERTEEEKATSSQEEAVISGARLFKPPTLPPLNSLFHLGGSLSYYQAALRERDLLMVSLDLEKGRRVTKKICLWLSAPFILSFVPSIPSPFFFIIFR